MPTPLAGLSSEEAASRLAADGPNTLGAGGHPSVARQVLRRVSQPLVLLLLGASAISFATGDQVSASLVAAMALLSVVLDVLQEYKASRAAERLRASVALRATVVRDGRSVEVPASTLVAGDLVQLAAGSLVPADGRMLLGRDCFVNEALLTGEPYPVEKRPGADDQPVAAGNSTSLLLGSSIVSGTATMQVVATGPRTVLGQIGGSLERPTPPTAFELGTRRFGMLVLRFASVLTLFVLLVNAARGQPWLESFLFAVALAVGLTPELLPMIVSVTLARGAMRLAARRVVVKRLSAVQDLGAMTVLCTDKTGTLTEAQIRLERYVDADGAISAQVLHLAYLNSRADTGLRTPLDDAILAHTEAEPAAAAWRKLDEVPFDFERRRISVLVEGPGGERLLVMKGAFEEVLACCASRGLPGAPPAPLDEVSLAGARQQFHALAAEGFRVLAIGWKQVGPEVEQARVGDEAELTLAGLCAFEDPPKPSAGAAIAALGARGVAVKVLTGDHELVAQHVAGALGIEVRRVVTGPELGEMSDEALDASASGTTLFCRVTPAQKDRVILALRRRGAVVGYLGDGINDAPPLHSADVGISVDQATDVAREAADLILLDRDLGVLAEGVAEGRRTFGNVMKYVLMATSSNFGNMFSMAGASALLTFLPMTPLQVLLNNFLYDLTEIPLPLDEVDAEDLARPRRWDMAFIQRFMLTLGPVSSLFDFGTFALMLWVFHANAALFRTGWFVESLATQSLVIFVIRTRRVPWRSRPHPVLVAFVCTMVGVGIALPYSPLAPALGFAPLPLPFFAALLGMIVVYLAMAEGAKRWFYRQI